jgi:hypothetical protein
VAFFTWSATLGNIITLDNLKKHIIVVGWCYGEIVDHLLFLCKLASALWNSIFGLFGSPQRKFVWKMISLCLMWCIWREREDHSFEDIEKMVAKLKTFFNSHFRWMAASDCFNISSFQDFFLSSSFLFCFVLFFCLFVCFFFFFSSPLLVKCFSCIHYVYLGVPFSV